MIISGLDIACHEANPCLTIGGFRVNLESNLFAILSHFLSQYTSGSCHKPDNVTLHTNGMKRCYYFFFKYEQISFNEKSLYRNHKSYDLKIRMSSRSSHDLYIMTLIEMRYGL